VSANSAFSASNLKRIYGIDGGVLYPSVDLSEFPREASSGETAAFDSAGTRAASSYAFTIGRISRFKGSHETIDHLTGSGLGLVVVGAGSASEIAVLKAHGRSRGVDVKVLNGLGSETLRAIMRNAAAVIGLAHGEAFGLTPIEAMALGVPPLFVDEGGYRETVVDGVNGRLLKRGDMASWSTALNQARNPDIRNEWAAAGLARIEELGLTPQTHAARLKAIIDALLV
jgi:glycosyltransferase involved in cell wall biosynthesis